MICLPCLFAPHVGFLCIFYTLAHMFMHESCLLVCRPCLTQWGYGHSIQTYICPLWTPSFCLPLYLFVFFLVCFLACLPSCFLVCLFILWLVMFSTIRYACHAYHALCLFHTLLASFSFHFLFASFLSLPLHVHTWSEDAWSWARSPRRKQKGLRCKHANISQAAMFSRFRGLASPIWFCTLLNPFPSSLLSLLDGLY